MPARQPHYSCSWKVYYEIGCALQASNVGSWQSCALPVVRLSNTVSCIYLLLWSDPQQACLNTAYHPLQSRSHPVLRRGLKERSKCANESHSDDSTWNPMRKQKSRPDKRSESSSNPTCPPFRGSSLSPFPPLRPPPPPWLHCSRRSYHFSRRLDFLGDFKACSLSV